DALPNPMPLDWSRCPPLGLPLPDYLARLVDEHHKHRDELVATGRWESELFFFTRLAKAHPDLVGLSAEKAIRKLESLMSKWPCPKTGKKVKNPWPVWFDISREDAHTEIVGIWDQLRYLPGLLPLQNAVDEADRSPLKLNEEVAARRSFGYSRLVSLAGWLQ